MVAINAITTIPLAIPDPDDANSTVNADYYSYVSPAQANQLLRLDPIRYARWSVRDATSMQEALVASTDRIDRHRFKGTKVDVMQELEFPRNKVVIDGQELPPTPFPKNLVLAVAKFAVTILDNPEAYGIPNREDRSVQSETVGRVSTSYFHPESINSSHLENLSSVDNEVWLLLQPLLAANVARVQYTQSDNTCPPKQWYETDYDSEYSSTSY